jgi:hypothetical protein
MIALPVATALQLGKGFKLTLIFSMCVQHNRHYDGFVYFLLSQCGTWWIYGSRLCCRIGRGPGVKKFDQASKLLQMPDLFRDELYIIKNQ